MVLAELPGIHFPNDMRSKLAVTLTVLAAMYLFTVTYYSFWRALGWLAQRIL